MQLSPFMTDDALLAELGARAERTRLERNISQQQLAKDAGVSWRTLQRLEAGEAVGMDKFIRVLRALGLLGNLEALVPEPPPSPIERMKTEGRRRKRASR